MAKKYNNNNSETETEMSSCCSFGLGPAPPYLRLLFFGFIFVSRHLNFVVRQKFTYSALISVSTSFAVVYFHIMKPNDEFRLPCTQSNKFMSNDVNPACAIYFLNGKWLFFFVRMYGIVVGWAFSFVYSFHIRSGQSDVFAMRRKHFAN